MIHKFKALNETTAAAAGGGGGKRMSQISHKTHDVRADLQRTSKVKKQKKFKN
jgi:hypothetical protein